mmetsp:Transcript_29767/g.65022  ORF Transcript_29767/g.65022 Transcript_29767/m.65022 type:complete len:200 (+) Transcript_29767:730-1329(+)
MGSTQAISSDSLWWECHQPGGVTNTPPLTQSTRTGFTRLPSASSWGDISVYTFGSACTARSSATELWRCGRCTVLGASELSSDHSTCVRVFVCGHATLPSSTPHRLSSVDPGSWRISSTRSRRAVRVHMVGSNLASSGRVPRYLINGSSDTQYSAAPPKAPPVARCSIGWLVVGSTNKSPSAHSVMPNSLSLDPFPRMT